MTTDDIFPVLPTESTTAWPIPVPDVTLSDEQQAAVTHLTRESRHRQVQTLGGYAGTGKTTIAKKIYSQLSSFAVCAFTGKAADMLRRKGLPGQTIHSLIYRPVKDAQGRIRWEKKGRHELGCSGFLVDEGSMVARDLFEDLKAYGHPIIVLGDHGQLPPVGDDPGLMKNPDIKLETIHRNAGPIAYFAEYLRKGGDARTWKWEGDYALGGRVIVIDRNKVTNDYLLKADQVICAFNKTRVGLNKTIRRLLIRAPYCDYDEPVPGDRVMCLRNDRVAFVFNGQQGVCETVDPILHEMTFKPTHGMTSYVHYDADSWNAAKAAPRDDKPRFPGRDIPFDFAYCVTAHKFQGDECDKLIVFEEKCSLWEHSRWAYTAASRAKQCVMWAY